MNTQNQKDSAQKSSKAMVEFREVVNIMTNNRTYYVDGRRVSKQRFELVQWKCRRRDCFSTKSDKGFFRFFSFGYLA